MFLRLGTVLTIRHRRNSINVENIEEPAWYLWGQSKDRVGKSLFNGKDKVFFRQDISATDPTSLAVGDFGGLSLRVKSTTNGSVSSKQQTVRRIVPISNDFGK